MAHLLFVGYRQIIWTYSEKCKIFVDITYLILYNMSDQRGGNSPHFRLPPPADALGNIGLEALLRPVFLTHTIRWLAFTILALTCQAQRISVGVVGGTNVSSNFPQTDVSASADSFGNPANRSQVSTGPRSFIIGALFETRFTDNFSVEANILHRPLKIRYIFTEFYADRSNIVSVDTSTAVRAWEFPVMAKYRLPIVQHAGRLRPFLTIGPSFRTQEDARATQLSRFGVSAGVGGSFTLGRLQVAPTIRYTRWSRGSTRLYYGTKPDQLEFLTTLAYDTGSQFSRIMGDKVTVGVMVGGSVGDIFLGREFRMLTDLSPAYVVGLGVQIGVTPKVSFEVDALYKPLRAELGIALRDRFTVLTWQFPMLARYTLRKSQWGLFGAIGPSLRLAGNLNGLNPSHYGITAGIGVEKRVAGMSLSPTLRYTRWARDVPTFPTQVFFERTSPNALEVVVGVSF